MGVYSFIDTTVTWTGPGGTISLGNNSGAAEEGVTLVYDDDIGHMDIGASGDIQHSLHANKSGTLTFRLLKTSPTNQRVSTKIAFQRASSVNYGQDTVTITNIVTGDIVTCQRVAPKHFTPLSYAKDAGMNEWILNVGLIEPTLGGNIF